MTVEERKIGARLRERFRYIDTLAEPERTLAVMGVPETEWSTYAAFSSETIGLMKGTLVRRFTNGHWETVRRGTDTPDT